MNHYSKSEDKNTGVVNIIDSKYNQMFSYMILLYSVTGKKESELCNIPYVETPSHTM